MDRNKKITVTFDIDPGHAHAFALIYYHLENLAGSLFMEPSPVDYILGVMVENYSLRADTDDLIDLKEYLERNVALINQYLEDAENKHPLAM